MNHSTEARYDTAMVRASDPLAPFATGSAPTDPREEQSRREIAARIPPGLRVDLETCFPKLSGWGAAKVNDRRVSWLERAAPVLERIIASDDRIKYIQLCVQTVWSDNLAAGYWAALMNRRLLVVTEKKLIVIDCDGKGAPGAFANQIPFTAIKKLGGFLASFTVTLAKGNCAFQIDRASRKAIEALIPLPGPGAAAGGLEHICPACFAPATEHVPRCASCNVELKSPKSAAIRSLILPGLGSWYVGSRGFAILQIVRTLMLWGFAFALLVVGIAKEDGDAAAMIALFLAAIVVFHGLEALVSRAQARKGLIALNARIPADRR